MVGHLSNMLTRQNKGRKGKMRIKIVLLTTLFLAFSSLGFAQSKTTSDMKGSQATHARPSAKTGTIEQLAAALSEAFTANALGRLDAQQPKPGTVKIVVEHSISGRIETKNLTSFARVEQWLKSRERKDGPARNGGPLQQCRRSVCTYEQLGMLHNNLYLQKVTYGLRKGQPYIKAIYVIDGD